MSISATSSFWKAVENTCRSPNALDRPVEQVLGLLRPRTPRRARRPPTRRAARSAHAAPPPSRPPVPRRLAPGEECQLVVARAVAERAEALLALALLQPAVDRPVDGVGELLGRHAAEDRPPDGRVRAEAAAQADVVGLASHALLVAHRRALEADVADPVVAAGVRAAVEVQREPGDLVAEAGFELVDDLVEPRLRLGDGEVAVRLAGAGDRIRAERLASSGSRAPEPLADAPRAAIAESGRSSAGA